jgi:hypothetical protein
MWEVTDHTDIWIGGMINPVFNGAAIAASEYVCASEEKGGPQVLLPRQWMGLAVSFDVLR